MQRNVLNCAVNFTNVDSPIWITEIIFQIITIIDKINQILDYIPELIEFSQHAEFFIYFVYEEVKAEGKQLPRPINR